MLFYLNEQPFIHILFLYISSSPWNITKDATMTLPAEYNEQLHLCQIECPSFHTDSGQLRAQHCRWCSNHSNGFILLDDRAVSPRAKRRRAAASQVAPQSQMHCRKHSRGCWEHKSSGSTPQLLGVGLGRTRQPHQIDPSNKSRSFTCNTLLISRNYPNFPHISYLYFLWYQYHLKTRAL